MTYAELTAAIASWMHRSDLTSQIDTFIDLTEAAINRELRTIEMESATTVSASATVALPAGFIEMRSIKLDVNPAHPLEYAPPYTRDALNDGASGEPKYYTLADDVIYLMPSPDSAYNTTISYYKQITPLDATNTTNFLSTSHPDLYLHGCLQQACMYTRDPQMGLAHKQEFETLLGRVNREGNKSRWSGSPKVVRAF